MIGQVWIFQNGYGDLTTVSVEAPGSGTGVPPGQNVVLHYTKSNARAYWMPVDPTAELWFMLHQESDGGWTARHMFMSCTLCVPGHTAGTLDVVPGPGGYTIVPAQDGLSLNAVYQPFWQYDVLTWDSGINSLVPGTIPWRTDSYVENVVTPVYSGPTLVSEQWENCPDVCIHEKWNFAPGMGLVRIRQLDNASGLDDADPKLWMDRIQ